MIVFGRVLKLGYAERRVADLWAMAIRQSSTFVPPASYSLVWA
jgi:hypothetical protein